jgi:hypothetical protein
MNNFLIRIGSPNPKRILLSPILKVNVPGEILGRMENLKLIFSFFGEAVMGLFVARNLHQHRMRFCCFKLLYKAVQSGRVKTDSRYFEDCISQIPKGQCLLGSSTSKALLYQLRDVTPGSHVSGPAGFSPFMNNGIIFFIRPHFRRSLFLFFFVGRAQVIDNCWSANSIVVSYRLKNMRLGIDFDEFVI